MSVISLKNIQSNILRYHFRKQVCFVFIRFNKKPNAIKDWVSDFPRKLKLSNAQNDLDDYRSYKNGKPKNSMVCSLLFSKTAFEKMGFKNGDAGLPKDPVFWKGMKERGAALNDPAVEQWEGNYQKEADALIILANNSMKNINKKKDKIRDSLKKAKVGRVLFAEYSDIKENDKGDKIEQFGYKDGMSQPMLWKGDQLLQYNWKIALEDDAGGSYMVYRKLEQNVKLFNEKKAALARELKLPEDYIEARMLGRYKDGRPLVDKYTTRLAYMRKTIDYSTDPEGLQCPFHAHARKMTPSKKEKYYNRIIRRGLTYDNRKDKSDAQPESGVGLLFLCYQSSIKDQFEVLQSKWANDSDYPSKQTGVDPFIGQQTEGKKPRFKRDKYCTARESYNFNGTVRLLGGDYFFAPGIAFIKGIKTYPKRHTSSNYNYGSEISFDTLLRISNVGRERFE